MRPGQLSNILEQCKGEDTEVTKSKQLEQATLGWTAQEKYVMHQLSDYCCCRKPRTWVSSAATQPGIASITYMFYLLAWILASWESSLWGTAQLSFPGVVPLLLDIYPYFPTSSCSALLVHCDLLNLHLLWEQDQCRSEHRRESTCPTPISLFTITPTTSPQCGMKSNDTENLTIRSNI